MFVDIVREIEWKHTRSGTADFLGPSGVPSDAVKMRDDREWSEPQYIRDLARRRSREMSAELSIIKVFS
jgi:hypothetical protein